METIRLEGGAWRLDRAKPLGTAGGFGAVFEGESTEGTPVAIKRLHLDREQAGHRELRIARELAGHNYQYVIPVLDSGADVGGLGYFVVMARADCNLQKIVDAGRLTAQATVDVLRQIAAGLEEIANLVHRDLKPQNVLSHEGKWKLADLGIAKFVVESTSEQTLRGFLSAQYAAPEQWRGESVTKKTDVYALGCIGYALLTGSPPFSGTRDDLREKHLQQIPSPIADVPPALSLLLSMCLRKTGEARPDLASVRRQLDLVLVERPKERSQLVAAAAAEVAKKDAERDSEVADLRRVQEERRTIAIDGVAGLQAIFKQFFDEIHASAPNAIVDLVGQTIQLGVGSLNWMVLWSGLDLNAFARSRWDVVAGALIRVTQPQGYRERSANLWFMRHSVEETYRWIEVSYVVNPLVGGDDIRVGPFGFNAGELGFAAAAMGPAMAPHQLHSPVTCIEGEYQDAFFERWMKRLSLASTGRMTMDS